MEQKQNISVTLKVKEIIFDIMNKTHLTGHAREAEGKKNYEAASYMQASADEEASYQIRRSVSNAFASIKVRMGEYLNEDKTTTDNRINRFVDNIDLSDEDRLKAIQAAVEDLSGDNDTDLDAITTAAAADNATLSTVMEAINVHIDDVKQEVNRQAIINAVDGTKAELHLAFLMPSNFHNAAIDSLGNGCHQYIVNKAIADWFIIVNPEEAANYGTLAEEALETAKRALYKRARPQRPTYN